MKPLNPLIVNLSVVVHNRLLAERLNPDTEQARVRFLEALSDELDIRYDMPKSKKQITALGKANKKVIVASRLFFAKADIDNNIVSIFTVRE